MEHFKTLAGTEQHLNATIKNVTTTKQESGEVLVIEGWANRYSIEGEVIVDRDQESILPTAYDLENYFKNPIVLYMHRRDRPAGKAIDIKVTGEGLYIKAEIHKAINPEVYAGVASGVLKTFSVGFRGKGGMYHPDVDIYYYTDVELTEVSIVTIPANADSLFTLLDSSCTGGMCALGFTGASQHKNFQTKEESVTTDDKQTIYTDEQLQKLKSDLEAMMSSVDALQQKREDDGREKDDDGAVTGEQNLETPSTVDEPEDTEKEEESDPGPETGTESEEPKEITVAEAADVLNTALKDPEKLEELVGVYENFSVGVNGAVEAFLTSVAESDSAE